MLRFIVLATVALMLFFLLQATEAKRNAGEGFCYKKINTKTGECKSKIKQKLQKVDCCSESQGGAGWSVRRKDRTRCEPCRTSVVETSYWSEWSDWSKCNATCGPSVTVSRRMCISKGKKPCRGRNEKWKPCLTTPCPIDGGWSPWGNWTSCSVTCEKGRQTRTRTCTNPAPQFGGKDCQGQLESARSCMDNEHCPIHGGWGEWSRHWSACSLTCGLGVRTRERQCDSPKPQYGGRPCNETQKREVRHCRERKCEPEFSGSGSGEGWETGEGSGSGASGSGSGESGGWEGYSGQRAWSDDEDY
ncbi:hypothetical protein ACROYT_G003429 [Oculina patagonica]